MTKTLLIIDDHDSFRHATRDLFQRSGFIVVGEVATGEDGLRAARDLRPDIVLLDIALPGLDGFAVCAQLTQESNAAAIVLTSTRDASAYRRRLQSCQAVGFITKSRLTPDALVALVG